MGAGQSTKAQLVVQWIATVCIAQSLGLGIVFVGTSNLVPAWMDPGSPALTTVWALQAGAINGMIVGSAQLFVARRRLRTLRTVDWLSATVIATVLCWMTGVALASPSDPSGDLMAKTAGFGLGCGLLVGTMQWFALRRAVGHDRDAWVWIGANALGWSLGLALALHVLSSVAPTAAAAALAVLAAVAGVGLSLPAALLTAVALLAITRE